MFWLADSAEVLAVSSTEVSAEFSGFDSMVGSAVVKAAAVLPDSESDSEDEGAEEFPSFVPSFSGRSVLVSTPEYSPRAGRLSKIIPVARGVASGGAIVAARWGSGLCQFFGGIGPDLREGRIIVWNGGELGGSRFEVHCHDDLVDEFDGLRTDDGGSENLT